MNDHPEVAKCLLECGADVNITNNYGNSPLHQAIERRSPTHVQMLLSKECSINVQNGKEQTPLHFAINAFKKVWKYYRVCASVDDLFSITASLLNNAADVNIVDYKGRNPLLLLSSVVKLKMEGNRKNAFSKLQKMILQKNSNTNCQDVNGDTVLHPFGKNMDKVLEYSLVPLIIQLIEHGADISRHNNDSQSFYTLLRNYSLLNPDNSELLDIQEVLLMPSLQCLSLCALYSIRERIELLPHLPKLVKQQLDINE